MGAARRVEPREACGFRRLLATELFLLLFRLTAEVFFFER
jgi:hypothetical protein